MTLRIYSTPGASYYSENQDQAHPYPFTLNFDGRTGGIEAARLYVREDSTGTYTSIKVTPVSVGGNDLIKGANGWTVKLKAGDLMPTLQEWDTIAAGNTINLGSLGDAFHYLPFWIQITVPSHTAVKKYKDVGLLITAA